MQLTELMTDISRRWVEACKKLDNVAVAKAAVVRYVYAYEKCYDIKNYDGRKIIPHTEVLSKETGEAGYKYGLDSEGRPCYLVYEHLYNQMKWEGCFIYTDKGVTYLEINSNEHTLVIIQRNYWENGQVAGYQSLSINGGHLGPLLAKQTPEILIRQLEANWLAITEVERYRYEGGRLAFADCWGDTPGIGGMMAFERQYHYDDTGVLQDTFEKYEDGNSQYTYVRFPEGHTLAEVADELSALMAEAIVDGLLAAGVDEPLSMLEINYQHTYLYTPQVMILTTTNWKQQSTDQEGRELYQVFFDMEKEEISIADSSFHKLLIAFTLRVIHTREYETAREMMRNTAKLLTMRKLFGKVPISDDFIAYAADWSIDETAISDLLKSCGMSNEALAYWRSRGLFMYDE